MDGNRMNARRDDIFRWLAVSLGSTNAAVTAYWLAGGTALLSTIGGEIEEWGRRRTADVLIVLGVVLFVKLAISTLPLVVDRIQRPRLRRVGRLVAWTAATGLTVYGGVLTSVGVLVQAGVLEKSQSADEAALRWHAYLWDPWFLAWGVALTSWLRATARARSEQA
jgi:hypothetical protein